MWFRDKEYVVLPCGEDASVTPWGNGMRLGPCPVDGVALGAAPCPTAGAGDLPSSSTAGCQPLSKDAVPWSSAVLGRADWPAIAALLKDNHFVVFFFLWRYWPSAAWACTEMLLA